MAPEQRREERLAFNLGRGTVLTYRQPSRSREAGSSHARPRIGRPAVAGVEPRSAKSKGDWAYWGLLAFTTVLLLRPQDDIPGLSMLHLAEVTAVAAAAAMVMQRLNRGLPLFRLTAEAIGLLAFGGAILLSIPFSIWPGGVVSLFFQSWAKMLIVFVLMVNTLTTPRRLEQFTWLIVSCCGYIAARSLFDYARGFNLVEGDRLGGPVSGIFGNPNDLAMNLVTFLPIAVVLALAPRTTTIRRFMAAAIALLMLATIVLTKSRGGTLGLVGLLVALVFLGHRIRKGFAAIAIACALAATPMVPASFWERMASIVDDQKDKAQFTGSREARSTVMMEGLQVFAERPLWGVGAGQFPNYDPPDRKERWRETHNALIQVAAEMGLPGLIAFTFLIVQAWLAAIATRRMIDPPTKRGAHDRAAAAFSMTDRRALQLHTVAVTAGLAGWCVCAQFASVAYNWTFYYLLALIVAARELTRNRISAVERSRGAV